MTSMPGHVQGLGVAANRAQLGQVLARQLGAERVVLDAMHKLSGGAVQENWALDATVHGGALDGTHAWVLRTDALSAVASSLGRLQEHAVLCVAAAAGVRVPRPVVAVDRDNPLQRPFFVMERLEGIAAGHRLTREAALVPNPEALLRELGQSLGRLHKIQPPSPALDFLSVPEGSPALANVAAYRAYLDTLDEPQPVLEWGLRWCERHAPREWETRLIHRDFRTGNYLVANGRLSGVLDWEFTGFGDPREDIGWFTARCWRFAAPDKAAGGIGAIEPFLAAYHEVSGLQVSAADLVYWQVMAHLRWGVIALQQAQRFLTGNERTLELALTGRLLPELEIEILGLIEGAAA